MCSYPYFEVFYRYDKYGIYDSNFDFLSRFKDVTEDGAKQVIIFINIGSREKVMFTETYPGAEGLGLGDLRFFRSQIFKYNTRLRKIRSERSKVKKTQKRRLLASEAKGSKYVQKGQQNFKKQVDRLEN